MAAISNAKTIVIPRQDRDKHKEALKEEACFAGPTDQAAVDEAQAADGRDEETLSSRSASRTHWHIHISRNSKSGEKGCGGGRNGGSVSCVGLAADDRGEAATDAVVLQRDVGALEPLPRSQRGSGLHPDMYKRHGRLAEQG